MTKTERNNSIVIGAGLAGLAAAATLAKAGCPVTVLDQGEAIGGRAKTVDRDGFLLNEGPHALYCAGRAMRELRALGIEPRGAAPALDRAGVAHGGSVAPLPVSPGALLSTPLLSARSKLTAAQVLPRMQRGHDRRAAGLTLAEWFERRHVPNDLRRMIEMYVRLTTYSNAPEVLAAPVALSQFKLSLSGVLYLHDGWRQLVNGLRRTVELSGGSIVQRAPVVGLERSAGQWEVTSANGNTHHGRNVVLAVGGPAGSTTLAGQDPGWVEQAGPPTIVATLDLGVEREPTTPVLLATGEPLYGSTHAPPARLAPDERGLVGIMRYLVPGEVPDRHALRCQLDAHAQLMGVTAEHIVVDRYLHRMTASHGTVRADCERPGGDELAGQRLWCAGDWIGRSGADGVVPLLADASVGSGVDAARAIIAVS